MTKPGYLFDNKILRRRRGVAAKITLLTIMALGFSSYYSASSAVAETIPFGTTETIPGTQTSPWMVGGSLDINGEMIIGAYGEVINNYGYLGYSAGDSGRVEVDGPGSIWINNGTLNIGFSGDGALYIKNGATVTDVALSTTEPAAAIGWGTGSSGTVTVDGSGSTWANNGRLFIGRFGYGALTVSGGGLVSNAIAYIGMYASSSGTVTVDGPGSIWASSGDLYVGYSGSGSLAVSHGAEVENSGGYIGVNAGSSGAVSVDGEGSIWASSLDLSIGRAGSGSLAITDGGKVSNGFGYIGEQSGSSGAATVDGSGSIWENSDGLYVGYNGIASLAITDGGKVSDVDGLIGADSAGQGTVTVDGSGSIWENSDGLYVGYYGTGALTVSDRGLASAGQGVLIAADSAADGTLEVSSGGTLETPALIAGDGNAAVTFDDGRLRATADNPYFIYGFEPAELDIGIGGLTIDDGGYDIATDASLFSGLGGLTKTGAGTLTLGGGNTYSGGTLVAFGTLKAGADGVFSPASAFTVNSGATLDLDGFNQSIAGLTNSGEVRLGSETSASPAGATLTVTGVYESNGGSLYLRSALGGDSSSADKLVVDTVTIGPGGATKLYIINIGGLGAATIDGLTVVEVVSGGSVGDAFTLGTAVTAGAYEYALTQGADLNWYLTSFLTDDGSQTPDIALYNPNIGSYLGNQYAAAMMFNQNILDRQNSVRSPDRAFWLRTGYQSVRSDILGGKQSMKVKTFLVQAGADLIEGNDFTFGVYAGYGHGDIDNRSRQTGTTADGKVDGRHIGVYLNWVPEKNPGPYVDLWAYRAWYDNELSGPAQPWGKTKYNGTGYALSGEVGYGFEFHRPGGGALTLEPHAQLTYVNIDADNFTDKNGTRYTDNHGGGLQTRLGARLYRQPDRGTTGFKPFVELNWLRNDVDSGLRLNNEYVDSGIGRNVGEVKVGFLGQATENLSAWGHIAAQTGCRGYEGYGAQLGLGWRW